jgi:hypothetical protein
MELVSYLVSYVSYSKFLILFFPPFSFTLPTHKMLFLSSFLSSMSPMSYGLEDPG